MKNISKYILAILLLSGMTSCMREMEMTQTPASGYEKGVTAITLTCPGMAATTRAIDGTVPVLTELDIFMFVFDGNRLVQTTHILPTQTDAPEDDQWYEGLLGHDVVRFGIKLPQTEENAVIHFIAIDDASGDFANQIDRIGTGLESMVMPQLRVSGTQDAYWQRVDLGCRIISKENEFAGDEPTEEHIQNEIFSRPIPLIRNFAKISLSLTGTAEADPDFVLLGWTVVNERDASAVVPWYSPDGSNSILFPEYADFSKSHDDPDRVKTYEDLTKQGYIGVSVSDGNLRNTIDEFSESAGESWNGNAKYVYERKNVSVNPLYILMYGRYKGHAGYYKLSLGFRDPDTGLVTPYNVLRNIAYHIKVSAVSAYGHKTPLEAANAPASNNVSGDVTTKNLLAISDGVDKLYVNQINFVVTNEQADEQDWIELRYRYVVDIEGLSTEGKRVANEKVVIDHEQDGVRIGLPKNGGSGTVIEKWQGPEKIFVNGDEWYSVKIKTKTPTEDLLQETFTIFTPPTDGSNGTLNSLGLSRTINLVLRKKWNFEKMQTYPGHWEDASRFPDFDPNLEEGYPGTPEGDANLYIGSQLGAPLTIFWRLPAGLPEAMFPLDFALESDRQNIENAGVGSATVESGPSIFPNVYDNRVKYIKTVTWDEYAPDGENSTPQSRVVRARFLTTTNIKKLGDDSYDGIVTTVGIHNPYFNDIVDKFERNTSVDIVKRTVVTRTWDFTDTEDEINGTVWETWANNFKRNYYGYTNDDPTNARLMIHCDDNNNSDRWWSSEITKDVMRKWTDEEGVEHEEIRIKGGFRYFRSQRTGSYMSFTIANDVRVGRYVSSAKVTVTGSDDSDDGSATDRAIRIAVGGMNSNTVTFSPNLKQDYSRGIPILTEDTPIYILPNADNQPVRIFKIVVEETYDENILPK